MSRPRRALLALGAVAAGAVPAAAHAADPGRWTETGRSTVPDRYYQGVASDPDGRIFFDGFFRGLYRTNGVLDEKAGTDDVFPPKVASTEHYNHVGDIAWDAREGGRVLLPTECYYPGTTGPGDDPANTCKTGSIAVADPGSLKWRYYVKLDPAEVPKAMWVVVSPNGKLVWTQAGSDLLAYSMDDISPSHAAPSHAPIKSVRRLANAVPSGGITGAVFHGGRMYVAGTPALNAVRLSSIDVKTGKRRVEIEKRIADAESEGLDVFTGLGGTLHWLIQRNVGGLPSYLYANGLLLHFVPHGKEPSTKRSRLARLRLSVSPRHVDRGEQVQLAFDATARVAGELIPIDKAVVSLGKLSATTDSKGHATITFSSNRVWSHKAKVTRANLRPGSTSIRVREP